MTGVAVAGFGGGAAVLSSAIEGLLGAGLSPLDIFLWMGIIYGAVILVSGMVLANPPDSPPPTPHWRPRVRRDPRFWRLFGAMLAGTFAGLLIIGNLKRLGLVGGGGGVDRRLVGGRPGAG